ncbi:acyltransferase family protein [Nocardioides dongxiaopingii]|uniref:acyltransferase family protein n=1 Tax=Nocardioides dongxiaopingii TaxID=2576036 RepID=UPI001485788C|nr:acyltransferase [Nocardioides dongxiaopingii]
MPETSLPPVPRPDPRPAREQWADVAKGVCIVLVVLWHVTRKDYLVLPWDVGVPVTGAWGRASELLLPVRMPLFFLISGLFAARQVQRPWPEVWRRRVAPLVYLFVLWTLVHTVVLQATPGFDTAIADGPCALLVQLSVTPGNLWYLLALALYVAVARATRSVPHWALAGALVLSAVASAGLVPTPGNRAGLLVNMVWFLLGVRAGRPAARVPAVGQLARARPRVVLAVVAVFAGAAGLWQALDADAWVGVRPVLGLLGILAGVAAAGVLARTSAGPALAALGRRTLPVYVLHLPLVALVHLAAADLVVGPVARSLPLAVLYPVLVSAVVVVACLALHRLAGALGAWWLFTAPWSGRAAPARARAT